MPAKKSTSSKNTKKTTSTKKPSNSKKTTSTKKTTTPKTKNDSKKTPSVIVKENTVKHDSNCNGTSCTTNFFKTITIILLVLNTILLIFVLKSNSNNGVKNALEEMEAERIGGTKNYELLQEIYDLKAYKEDQKSRLEQTINALKSMGEKDQIPSDLVGDNNTNK